MCFYKQLAHPSSLEIMFWVQTIITVQNLLIWASMVTNTYLTINNIELLGIFDNDVRQTADITLNGETNRKNIRSMLLFGISARFLQNCSKIDRLGFTLFQLLTDRGTDRHHQFFRGFT